MNRPSRPSVTAILACHNRRAKTLACLDSLAQQDADIALRIVLFDDGSTDGTVEAVRLHHPDATILTGDGTAFWAGGMRKAFAAALAEPPDFTLWLNDDVRLARHALRVLLATAVARAATGDPLCLVGGATADPVTGRTTYGGVRHVRGARRLRFHPHPPHPTNAVRCDTLNGNIVLVPRITAARIGNIGSVFQHTLGDLDYGLRVEEAGGWVGLAPGHLGICARGTGRWFDPELPLAVRWRLVAQPLGFPFRPWLHFAHRHGGPAWWLFALLPYWRLLVPLWLARRIDRRRAEATSPRVRHA